MESSNPPSSSTPRQQVDPRQWFTDVQAPPSAPSSAQSRGRPRTNKHKSGGARRKVELQLRENFQRRLEEALQFAELEKQVAVENAYKEAQAAMEAEKARLAGELQNSYEGLQERQRKAIAQEFEEREKSVVAAMVKSEREKLKAEYDEKLKSLEEKTIASLKVAHAKELDHQKEKFSQEVEELHRKIKSESAAAVRAELEEQLRLTQAEAEREREEAIAQAKESTRQQAKEDVNKAVEQVLAASEQERQKAVEDALSRAEDEKQAAVSNVISKERAAKDAELQSLRTSMEQSAESRVDELMTAHSSKIQSIESEYQAKLAAAVESTRDLERRLEQEKEAAIDALRGELEKEKEAALASQQAMMDEKVRLAAEDSNNFKQLFYAESTARRQLHNRLVELQGNIRVFCRVRPVLAVEEEAGAGGSVVDFPGDEMITVSSTKNNETSRQRFEFDRTFAPGTSQENVFDAVQPLIVSVLDGYNVCIFAYGQTGSGKTFTMEGPESDPGVNRRAIADLFRVQQERSDMFNYETQMSMLEIYNEELHDLLVDPSEASHKKLEIRLAENGQGHDIPGLTKVVVDNDALVQETIFTGSKNRTVGRHNMNEHSSRSHLVLTLYTTATSKKDGSISRAKLHLIDLAGSERVSKTDATGQRLKEAQNINKSLSALGDVIAGLGKKASHVPFRNSKLTYLLQDSLTNNSKMQMFVNCSPAEYNAGETLCSLQFAKRCRAVELGAAKKNTESAEMARLKKQMRQMQEDMIALQGDDDELEGTGGSSRGRSLPRSAAVNRDRSLPRPASARSNSKPRTTKATLPSPRSARGF